MTEFFSGWRRKIGCVTLMMALVFVGGWIRSLSVKDLLWFDVGMRTIAFVESEGHCLALGAEFFHGPRSQWRYQIWNQWTSDPSSGQVPLDDKLFSWRHRWYGFGIAGNDDEQFDYWLKECRIPYWSITIPLTLLSAFLLLSKPRKLTPIKLTEPIAVEGV